MRRSEVVCLGEALVLLPDLTGGSQAGSLAGAEVNVAVGLAGAGVPTAWVGRLGDDPFGAFLHAELVRRRVDVGGVEIDRDRPTGCYAKQPGVDRHGEPATRMHYRRAGSAASAMGPAFLDRPAVRERLAGAAVVHCSGITAALSASCADLMRALLARPRGPLVCFDVNWREQMWPSGDAGLVAELAGRADVVLVGADEARRVFGTDDAAELRRQLPGPRLLVIKDGARRALAVDREGAVVEQPALRVDVLEPVGAGDAFAAGLLAGMVRGEPVERWLRRGHLGAAAALTTTGDSADPTGVVDPGPLADTVLDLPDRDWSMIRFSASGAR